MVKNEKGQHGIALMRFLDSEFDALGVAPTTWATDNGIVKSKFGRWRDGTSDPDLDGLEDIARALGRPTHDLLIAAGYIDAALIGLPPVTTTPPARIALAIEQDPGLTDRERDMLRDIFVSMQRHREDVPATTVSNRTRKARRAKTD